MTGTGVVIVSYNSADVIDLCLESCAGMRVVVVDNASNDGTVEQVKAKSAVELIANSRNLGFAAAVNQGVAALNTETILLLNPDVELQTPVTELAEIVGQSGIGIAAGKLPPMANPLTKNNPVMQMGARNSLHIDRLRTENGSP